MEIVISLKMWGRVVSGITDLPCLSELLLYPVEFFSGLPLSHQCPDRFCFFWFFWEWFYKEKVRSLWLPWLVYISQYFDPFRIFSKHCTCIFLDLKNVQLSCSVVLRIENLLTWVTGYFLWMKLTCWELFLNKVKLKTFLSVLFFYTCQTNLGDRWHEVLRKTGCFLKYVERYRK